MNPTAALVMCIGGVGGYLCYLCYNARPQYMELAFTCVATFFYHATLLHVAQCIDQLAIAVLVLHMSFVFNITLNSLMAVVIGTGIVIGSMLFSPLVAELGLVLQVLMFYRSIRIDSPMLYRARTCMAVAFTFWLMELFIPCQLVAWLYLHMWWHLFAGYALFCIICANGWNITILTIVVFTQIKS